MLKRRFEKEMIRKMVNESRGGVLKAVFDEISAFLKDRKAVSEGELRLKIRGCINSLDNNAKKALAQLIDVVEEDIEDVIFKSITTIDGKISVFSPDMRTKMNYQGEVFYCLPSHRFFAEELEQAFLRWAKIRSPPSSLKGIVEEFLTRCGYSVKSPSQASSGRAADIVDAADAVDVSAAEDAKSEVKEAFPFEHDEYAVITAEKRVKADKRAGTTKEQGDGRRERENREKEKVKDVKGVRGVRVFIFPSIKFVPRFLKWLSDACCGDVSEERIAVVVPTEKTPAPFISFFREHGEDIPEHLSIWVVDPESKAVNPFYGQEEDDEIERNFADAERARKAVSTWMRKMPLV